MAPRRRRGRLNGAESSRRGRGRGRGRGSQSQPWPQPQQQPQPEPQPQPQPRPPPPLYDLSLQRSALILSERAAELQNLPDDYAIPLVRAFLQRNPPPSVKELRDFCVAVDWVPQHLSLCGTPEVFSRRILRIIMLRNLVRLDLTGCVWLENLDFLPDLRLLKCLNLRGCWRLKVGDFFHIRGLPEIQCLDVENIPAVTDVFAETISGLTSLQALNVSGTLVSDRTAGLLTHGNRCRNWASQQRAAVVNSLHVQTELSRYPSSNLTYFRFQRTQITDATIVYLQELSNLKLLDVRHTYVTTRPFSSLKAKHRLTAPPNSFYLIARTNAMLAGVLRGECGCRSMALNDEETEEFTKLCQLAFRELLHKPDFEWYKLDFSVLPNR